jgi:hypothetical protein
MALFATAVMLRQRHFPSHVQRLLRLLTITVSIALRRTRIMHIVI